MFVWGGEGYVCEIINLQRRSVIYILSFFQGIHYSKWHHKWQHVGGGKEIYLQERGTIIFSFTRV